jgi:hypothetical protein
LAAIELLVPQTTEASERGVEINEKFRRSEELEPEPELERASSTECRDTRETPKACRWAREDTWVELMALRTAEAPPAR